jgi:hypothetical protein
MKKKNQRGDTLKELQSDAFKELQRDTFKELQEQREELFKVTMTHEFDELKAALAHKIDVQIRAAIKVEAKIKTVPVRKAESEPPIFAESLLKALLPARRREAIIGDFRERFGRDCEELGRSHAVRRYWEHCARSLMPLLIRAIVHGVKWGAIIEFFRHWPGLS